MKPTVYSTLHYPALILREADQLEAFRDRFSNVADFKAFSLDMRSKGSAVVTRPGADPTEGVFIGVTGLPNGRFAACLALKDWLCDTEQDARAIVAKLTAPGGECEGQNMLLMTVDSSLVGRA